MSLTTDTITDLHACYCRMTGLEVKQAIHERAWFDFIAKGFTGDDLRCVLEYLLAQNRTMKGEARFSLRLNRLLDFTYEHFDSILAEARAKEKNRRPKRTAASQALSEFRGRPEPEAAGRPPMTAGEILRKVLKP